MSDSQENISKAQENMPKAQENVSEAQKNASESEETLSDSQKRIDSIDRQLRLLDLLDETNQLKDKIEQQTIQESTSSINDIVSIANRLMDENKDEDALKISELVLDSILMRDNHELLSQVIQQTKPFNPEMLSTAIKAIVCKNNVYDWTKLAPYVYNLSRAFHTSPSMLGYVDFDEEPREHARRERAVRQKVNLSEEQRPETSSQLKLTEKSSTSVAGVYQQMVQLFEANERKPIPYYKLVVDPKSFGNTVDNAMKIALLLKTNYIGMDVGADGKPQVRLITPAERKGKTSHGAGVAAGSGGQGIINFNDEIIKRVCDFYNIKEAMLRQDEDSSSLDE